MLSPKLSIFSVTSFNVQIARNLRENKSQNSSEMLVYTNIT